MSHSYDEAVAALYQAAPESFVTERQRLAAELKASGDKPTAARVAKLARPPLSAWAVNQLWWHAREDFEELFETAQRLRSGKHTESGAHRKVIAKLSARAAKLLTDNGHAANDATLRRVSMTLSGLAASGSFEPDPAGALSKDRDPPGFEAFGIPAGDSEAAEEAAPPSSKRLEAKQPAPSRPAHAGDSKKEREALAAAKRREHAEAERARNEAAAEKQRQAAERARREAARRKQQEAVKQAKAALAERQHAHDLAAKALAKVERELEQARSALEAAQAALAETGDE